MSEQKEPARILYEKTPEGAIVQIRGTGKEIIAALVRLTYSVSTRFDFDVQRFAVALPALVELEKLSLDHTETIDLDAIQRAQRKGGST